MNANDYQDQALRTANLNDGDKKLRLSNWALGISGEAGEIAEHIKKQIHHGKAMSDPELAKEMGDLLWYVAVLAAEIGYPLEHVMNLNVAKLKARYPEGFELGGGIREESKPAEEPKPVLSSVILELSPAEYKAYRTAEAVHLHDHKGARMPGYTPRHIIDQLLAKGLIEAKEQSWGTGYKATAEKAQVQE